MRVLTLLGLAVVVTGCMKKDNGTPADTASTTAAASTPAPMVIALADANGKWAVTGKNEAGDSTLLTYVLTADTTGWQIQYADRKKPVAVRIVSVGGDSIVTESGPYPSVLRKGVMVTTNAVYRLQDGKLVARTVAHYSVKTPDSVRIVISEGVKK
jgi:hypothetical protein